MSGTSLDGLDICLTEFEFPNVQNFKILFAETVNYNEKFRLKLKQSIDFNGEELTKLDIEFGVLSGKIINEFIQKNKIEKVDLIASHGHTVFHNPNENYTLQIGNGNAIRLETGVKTVYDFRTQDVLLGGQGAPLVPIGDELLFGNYDACLNLGGISNISFRKNDKRIAFDISPFNLVLNHLAEKLGKPFDENGNLAKSGEIDWKLLDELNGLKYYQTQPPKSLGIEFCYENVFPMIENSGLKTEDLLATFSEHFAFQIAEIFNQNHLKNVLITGGGAYNEFFIKTLKAKTSTEIILPENQIIDFKEALIFALMGLLKIENQINVLASVTGAERNHSSGIVLF